MYPRVLEQLDSRLISIDEAAERCSVSPGTIRKWIRSGFFPCYGRTHPGVKGRAFLRVRLCDVAPLIPPESFPSAVTNVTGRPTLKPRAAGFAAVKAAARRRKRKARAKPEQP